MLTLNNNNSIKKKVVICLQCHIFWHIGSSIPLHSGPPREWEFSHVQKFSGAGLSTVFILPLLFCKHTWV